MRQKRWCWWISFDFINNEWENIVQRFDVYHHDVWSKNLMTSIWENFVEKIALSLIKGLRVWIPAILEFHLVSLQLPWSKVYKKTRNDSSYIKSFEMKWNELKEIKTFTGKLFSKSKIDCFIVEMIKCEWYPY